MTMIFCVSCSFIFNLSDTYGKYSFVVLPVFVCVHFLCYSFAFSSSTSYIVTLFVILLQLSGMFIFVDALFTKPSANSFPITPACDLTQQSVTFHSLPSSCYFPFTFLHLCYLPFTSLHLCYFSFNSVHLSFLPFTFLHLCYLPSYFFYYICVFISVLELLQCCLADCLYCYYFIRRMNLLCVFQGS